MTNSGDGSVSVLNSANGDLITTLTGFSGPLAVAVTPDGQTAYVVNDGNNTVTPITTATNTVGSAIPVGSSPYAVAVTPDGKTAYVANKNSGTVTPITVASNTAGTPISAGNSPIGVAVTPDGKTVYVTDFGGGTVTPITVASNTAGSPITVGNSPYGVAVTPDGKTAYVTNSGSGTVTPITVATNTAGTPITVGNQPIRLAVTPDGKTAYVTNYGGGTVTPITVATNTPGTPIAVSRPYGVAITPDGMTAYVADNNSSGTVTPITVATNTAGTPITVGAYPVAVAVAPTPVTAYVTNSSSGTLTPIAVATNTAGTAIGGFSGPHGIAVTPDGTTAYVVNNSGSVQPVNLQTDAVGSAIAVGSAPQGIAFTPDGQTAYVANYNSDTVSVISVSTSTVVATINVGSQPRSVAVTPDGKTAYVTNEGSTTVTPITVATNTAGTPITVGTAPFGVAITPDGQTAYVTNSGSTSVSAISVASNTVTATISVGSGQTGVAISPDGTTVYVNTGSGTVTPITAATNTAGTPITVASSTGFGLALTPDGATAYTTVNATGAAPINLATDTAGTEVATGTNPYGVAIAGPLTIGNATALPQSSAGASYSQQLWSVAGTSPLTYSVTSGSLPAGLSLSSSGVISGTPTATGTASFTAAVTDSSSYQRVAVKAFTLVVGLASPSIGTSQRPASATVGASVADHATVSGGSSPSGTVTFNLYDNPNRTGTPLFTDSEPLSGGSATSNGYTARTTGTDYWVATYNGDSNNHAVSSGNADEPVTISAASPSLSMSAPGSGTAGSKISASSVSAVLSGGDSPSGLVTFKVFGPQSSAPADCISGGTTVGTASVSGNGTYNPSSGFTPSQAGDYWWYASYGGDSNNDPAASSCGMVETVVNPLPPSSSAPPTISGTAQQGQTLSESHGQWSNSPTSYAYQWVDCNLAGARCQAISGATTQRYVLRGSDVGHTVRVVETASNGGGSASATSDPTGVVNAPSPSDLQLSTSGPVTRSGTRVDPGIALSCPAGGPSCSASESVTVLIGAADTPIAGARAQVSHAVTVGSASFTIPAGSTVEGIFHLDRFGMTLLSDHKRLPLQVAVSGQAQGQTRVTATKAIMLDGRFARYTVRAIEVHRDGTVTFEVNVSVPGQVNVLLTAWKDNVAVATRVLSPARERFVVARSTHQATSPGSLSFTIHPNQTGRRLIAHPAYGPTLRLWVSYVPTYAFQTDTGYYGLYPGHGCTPCHTHTWP